MSPTYASFADVAIGDPRRYGSARGSGVESTPTRRGHTVVAPTTPWRRRHATPRPHRVSAAAMRPYQAPTVDESR